MEENNVENQYTEELDFSNMQEELEKAKKEAEEIHESNQTYEAAPVESYEDIAAKLEEELESAPQEPVVEQKESGNAFVDEIRNAELNEAPAPQYEAAPVEVYTDTPTNTEPVAVETPVAPVYEAAPVETLEDVQKKEVQKPVIPEYNEAPVDTQPSTEKVKSYENPVAIIKFNTEPEEEQEYVDPKTIKLDFKGNKNLWFVVGLGVLLLIAIFMLPLFL